MAGPAGGKINKPIHIMFLHGTYDISDRFRLHTGRSFAAVPERAQHGISTGDSGVDIGILHRITASNMEPPVEKLQLFRTTDKRYYLIPPPKRLGDKFLPRIASSPENNDSHSAPFVLLLMRVYFRYVIFRFSVVFCVWAYTPALYAND